MACGGESGMDACRAEEHAPVGTTLCPKHAQRPPAWIFTSLNWEKNLFLMCAASKNDAPRHFLSDSKALNRSEEHTSELQSLMRITYAVFCLKKERSTEHDSY